MINEPGYRLNVGIIIINDKGKLLLCKRKNIDSWQFPQGGIDEGESPINASKRELFEEVGIKSNYTKLLSVNKELDKIRYSKRKKKESFLKKRI